MATSKKALEMAAELLNELALRLPALAPVQTFDTDGSPLIQVGTGVAGSKGGMLKIMPQPWTLATDILGLTSAIYTPSVIRVGFEANPAGGAGADINDWPTLSAIVGAVALRGTRVEVYQSTAGVAPTAATLADATKLVATFEPSLQYPMINNQ